jgi:hypothetical protein
MDIVELGSWEGKTKTHKWGADSRPTLKKKNVKVELP